VDTSSHVRRLLAAVLSTLLLGAVVAFDVVAPSAVSAAPGSFTVDDGTDLVDAGIDGECRTVADTCSLRAAVQEANAVGGTTQVLVAPGVEVIKLDIAGAGGAEVGDLNVDAGVTVQLIGNVLDTNRVVEVFASAMSDRHFHVAETGRLELVHVTLRDGVSGGDGGAILNEGSVLITNTADSTASWVALSGNRSTGTGGAIANTTSASLEVRNISATSSTNTRIDVSRNDAGTVGGAIANAGGTVQLVGSTSPLSHDVYLDNNTAVVDGGAVHNSLGGTVLLGCRAYTRFSTAERGGDVFNEQGTLTMDGGGADGGSATDGGGIFNATDGVVQVVAGGCQDAQITRSTATQTGGGLHNLGKVSIDAGAVLQISGAGSGGDAVRGGGVHQASGSIDVTGSLVVSGTLATEAGGALHVAGGSVSTSGDGIVEVHDSSASLRGGGIGVDGGSLSARVTLERNQSSLGGGVAVTGSGSAKLVRSALIDNTAELGSAAAVSGKQATLDLRNSTVARNSSPGSGGALVAVDGASLSLRHVTVADNSPTGVWSEGQLSLQRVLMARNGSQNCGGLAVSAGDFNVFDDPSCSPTGSDLTDSDLFDEVSNRLDGDLFDDDRWSYELRPGHPAIDQVTDKGCGDPSDDQVGNPRPVDGDGDGSAACDAGSREVGSSAERRTISGTVYDEGTVAPLPGACVFLLNTSSDDDVNGVAQTDEAGRYTAEVLPGRYLVAFFVPRDGGGKGRCDGEQIDLSYQPEWYRNVAVEFSDADDSDSDVVMPDPDEVTLVDLADEPVSGIDACLGAGPGAGLDAPCAEAEPDALGGVVPRAGDPGTPSGSEAAQAAAVSAPRSLAFTGMDLTIGLLSVALLAAGVGFLVAARRREDDAGGFGRAG
jgi:hypothetical protein